MITPRAKPTRAKQIEIEAIAAEWLARESNGLSSVERNERDVWLTSDPRHVAAYLEFNDVWKSLDHLVESPAGAALEEEADTELAQQSLKGRSRWIPIGLAAAAAITVSILGWNRFESSERASNAALTTAVGAMQDRILADGSVLLLNTDSAMQVHYTAGERRIVLLRGEAHFTVAKDPTRPFIVELDRIAIRAVGTAFNVRRYADSADVLVTEGRIEIAESITIPNPPLRLASDPVLGTLGQGEFTRIILRNNSAVKVDVETLLLEPTEMDRILAWRERRLEFVSTPLSEVVAEINRYSKRSLIIADPHLGAERFGGTIRTDQPETFVSLLEKSFSVTAERRTNDVVLRRSR